MLIIIGQDNIAFSTSMRDLMKKYGKVVLGVHFFVSFASIGGLYLTIKNNVDAESVFSKVGLSPNPKPNPDGDSDSRSSTVVILGDENNDIGKTANGNRMAELAASTSSALALAFLCNKALFPVRVLVMIALTPPIARFLARRNLIH